MKRIVLCAVVVLAQVSLASVVSEISEEAVLQSSLLETKNKLEERIKALVSEDIQMTLAGEDRNAYMVMMCYDLRSSNPHDLEKIMLLRRRLVKGLGSQVTFLESKLTQSLQVTILSLTTTLSTVFQEVLKKHSQYQFNNRLFVIPSPKEEDHIVVQVDCRHRRRLDAKFLSNITTDFKDRFQSSSEVKIRRTQTGLLFLIPVLSLATDIACSPLVSEAALSSSVVDEIESSPVTIALVQEPLEGACFGWCCTLEEVSCWSPMFPIETEREASQWTNDVVLRQLKASYKLG